MVHTPTDKISVDLDPACTPAEIENRSFAIIDAEIPEPRAFSGPLWQVARRCVHTLGDTDIVDDLRLSAQGLEAGVNALLAGCTVYTDTRMAAAGLPMRIGGCEWANSGNFVVPTLAGAGWQARSGDPCHINRPKFQALADQAAGVATCMIRERNLATASVGVWGNVAKPIFFRSSRLHGLFSSAWGVSGFDGSKGYAKRPQVSIPTGA